MKAKEYYFAEVNTVGWFALLLQRISLKRYALRSKSVKYKVYIWEVQVAKVTAFTICG